MNSPELYLLRGFLLPAKYAGTQWVRKTSSRTAQMRTFLALLHKLLWINIQCHALIAGINYRREAKGVEIEEKNSHA